MQGFYTQLKSNPVLRNAVGLPDDRPPTPVSPEAKRPTMFWPGAAKVEKKGDGKKRIQLSGKQTREFSRGHTDAVYCVCALDEKRIASGSNDTTIIVWDVTTGLGMTLIGHEKAVHSLAALSDNVLASASADRSVKLWSSMSGQCLRTLQGHKASVRALCLLPDGRLASGSVAASHCTAFLHCSPKNKSSFLCVARVRCPSGPLIRASNYGIPAPVCA